MCRIADREREGRAISGPGRCEARACRWPSREQYEAFKEAIENWRELERALDQMQKLTRQRIFGTLPETRRRKPLTKKVLGLI